MYRDGSLPHWCGVLPLRPQVCAHGPIRPSPPWSESVCQVHQEGKPKEQVSFFVPSLSSRQFLHLETSTRCRFTRRSFFFSLRFLVDQWTSSSTTFTLGNSTKYWPLALQLSLQKVLIFNSSSLFLGGSSLNGMKGRALEMLFRTKKIHFMSLKIHSLTQVLPQSSWGGKRKSFSAAIDLGRDHESSINNWIHEREREISKLVENFTHDQKNSFDISMSFSWEVSKSPCLVSFRSG